MKTKQSRLPHLDKVYNTPPAYMRKRNLQDRLYRTVIAAAMFTGSMVVMAGVYTIVSQLIQIG